LVREFNARMKILRSTFFLLIVLVTFPSCQRELFFDRVSTGILNKDTMGNCLPVAVNGAYKVDSVFTDESFIEVKIKVSFPGTFDIISDTVNGYFFHQTGTVDRGTSTIRLYAGGKPIAAGINNFTVRYGASTCNLNIIALGPQAAVYTLAGAPNICTGFFADGIYTTGTALTASNLLIIKVDVTEAGTYAVSATTANGFSFSGSGVFTATGLQNVILKGSGIPIMAEVSNVIVSNTASICNFGITVLSDTAGKAIFSFDGSPNDCINFTVNGTYYAGILTTANNTVTMSVNVTKPGSYAINTNAENGISFRTAGSFINTGPQTVILSARGTPVRSEATAFIPNTGTVSCNFLLHVEPLPPPAVFTLSGAPNACTPVTVNGFYIVSKPLDAANTVVIQVNVSTPGSYTISTNTVNGFSFSGSGVFTTTGLHNVILQGSGIPQVGGTCTFMPGNGTSLCTFSLPVI
jgi:hypothetical protein